MKYIPIVTLVFIALLGALAPMSADDFCHAADAATYGPLGSVSHVYAAWSGRYSHLAATGVLYTFAGGRAPAVNAFLTVLVLPLALVYALPQYRRALAGVVILAVMLLHPNVLSVLYWMPGAITYTWPLLGLLLLVGLFRRKAHPVVMLVVAFITAGFHESTALLLVVVALAYALWRRDLRSLAVLVGAGIGLMVVAAAPGNAVRSAQLPPPMPLIEAGVTALRGALVLVIERVFAAPVAVALLLALGWLAAPSKRLPQRGWLLAGLVTLGIGTIALALFPAYYALWGVPSRATTPAVALLAVMLLASGYVAGHGQRKYEAIVPMLSLLLVVTALGWALRTAPLMLSQALKADTPVVAQAFARAVEADSGDVAWVRDCRSRYLVLTATD